MNIDDTLPQYGTEFYSYIIPTFPISYSTTLVPQTINEIDDTLNIPPVNLEIIWNTGVAFTNDQILQWNTCPSSKLTIETGINVNPNS